MMSDDSSSPNILCVVSAADFRGNDFFMCFTICQNENFFHIYVIYVYTAYDRQAFYLRIEQTEKKQYNSVTNCV